MPRTRSRRVVAAAISVTERAEVFVARIASSAVMRSSSAKSSRFGFSSSTIASTIRSQSARSATSVVSERRPTAASRAAWSSCPFSTLRVRKCAIRSRDRESTRLNSSHANISYAVFCLQKKKHKKKGEKKERKKKQKKKKKKNKKKK